MHRCEVDDAAAAHRLPRDDHRAGRGPPPAQEADRRRRPVRRGVPARRAAAARRAASSSSTRSRAARFPASSSRRSRRACARRWTPAWSPAIRVMDVRVTVYDGKHHSVDSKEIAFITAGRKAFIDAVQKARADRARADRQRRDHRARARTSATSPATCRRAAARSAARAAAAAGLLAVLGQAPLAELSSYQSRLNAMTGGQGRYTLALQPLRGGAADGAGAAGVAVQGEGRGIGRAAPSPAWRCAASGAAGGQRRPARQQLADRLLVACGELQQREIALRPADQLQRPSAARRHRSRPAR